MIRNLVYDFGNVLVDYDYVLFFKWLYPDENRLFPFVQFINNAESIRIMERGYKPFGEIIDDFIREAPEFEQELRLFRDHKPECVTNEEPGMRELLTKLKAEGYRLYGLSNWDTTVYDTIREYNDIFKLLDGWVISCDVHHVKPEPEIFHCLFDKFGLKPEECFFADDKPENVEGAIRVGMAATVFTGAASYEAALRSMNNLESNQCTK